jgi:hypothetical protein
VDRIRPSCFNIRWAVHERPEIVAAASLLHAAGES